MGTWPSIRASWRLLNRRDHRILIAITVLQGVLSLLDLLGVALLAVVAALTAAQLSGQVPSLIQPAWDLLSHASDDPQVTVLLFAMIAGAILVAKSIGSYFLTRRTFRFLALRQAIISNRLAAGVLARPLIEIQQRSSQELSYALTTGVSAATVGIIGSVMVICSETFLIFVFIMGLAAVDLAVTLLSTIFFALVALGLHRAISGWAARLGETVTASSVDSLVVVQDMLRTFREVSVSGRRAHFLDRFSALRLRAARVEAELQVVNNVSKYVFEIALIVGGALLAASQLLLRDATAALSVVALFLIAASRVMPSLLRLQSGVLTITTRVGLARPALSLAAELHDALTSPQSNVSLSPEMRLRVAVRFEHGYPDFAGEIRIVNVSLTYPGVSHPAIEDVSITVAPGSSLALAGPTGAGKSTLADLILGVMLPDSGGVLLDGLPPEAAIASAPGAIAYVPQEIVIVSGTVRENVALILPAGLVSDERIWEALDRAHLSDLLRQERDGLDTVVGENGVQLSGGQRQRLGLARALLTRPKLLILDEATSALDAETEAAISTTLSSLEGQVTQVIVAHRLATIRHCDQIAYLEDGRLIALGRFDDVRRAAPNFNVQAELLGL